VVDLPVYLVGIKGGDARNEGGGGTSRDVSSGLRKFPKDRPVLSHCFGKIRWLGHLMGDECALVGVYYVWCKKSRGFLSW